MKNSNPLILPLCVLLLTGCAGANYSFRVTQSSFGIGEEIVGSGYLPGIPDGDEYETFSVIDADGENGFIVVSGGDFTQSRSRITITGRELGPDEEPSSMLITFGNRIEGNIDNSVSYEIRGGAGSPPFLFQINGTQVEIPGVEFITQLRNSENQSVAFSGSDPHVISFQMNSITREAIFTVIQSDFDDSREFELPDTFGVGRGLTIMSFAPDTQTHISTPVGVLFD